MGLRPMSMVFIPLTLPAGYLHHRLQLCRISAGREQLVLDKNLQVNIELARRPSKLRK